MNRNAMARYAREVPKELIVYELVDKSGNAHTRAAEALRDFRRRRREARCLTGGDEFLDTYDLLYLFDDEEIWEERAELIREEEELPHWWSGQGLDDDVELYERLKREAANAYLLEDFEDEDLLAYDAQEAEEHEYWAPLEGDWMEEVRPVDNAYDSGCDEPNEMNVPYPPVKGERFVDPDLKERRMKKCLDRMRRRALRREYNETRELSKRWRRLGLMAMRSEANCSFD